MTSWLDAVAERAGSEASDVQETLDRFRVRPNRRLPRPRQLTVSRIRFQGHRSDGSEAEDFEFDWSVGPGVWAVASDHNLVGKTTVLELIRFGIRGRADIQSDVLGWLRTLNVYGNIDEESFELAASFQNGRPSGALLVDGSEYGSFASQEAAEEIVGDFMGSRLGIEPLPYWSADEGAGSERTMTWLVYSSALYIKSLTYLIGEPESSWGGAAGKMLELFIGVPWASTLAAAAVAIRAQEQRLQALKRRRDLDARVASDAFAEIEADLQSAKEQLEQLPDNEATLRESDELLERLRVHDSRLVELRQRSEELTEQRKQGRQVELEDRRRLQDLTENEHAVAFFATLEPTMCPRCETAVTHERRAQEGATHECAVCGSHLTDHAEDPSVIASLEASVAQAVRLQQEAKTELDSIESEIRDLVDARMRIRLRAHRLTQEQRADETRRNLELRVARLEGTLEAHQSSVGGDDTEPLIEQTESDLEILKAAHAEAEARVRSAEGDLFGAVEEEVVRLARQFGMEALEKVALDRAARLRVVKGGSTTWYSHLTEGEKLRLKIALCLAMLRVGAARGVGRFPGLLLLDSPGQQETIGEDVVSILRELDAAVEDLGDLQIIAASAQADLVSEALPADHIRLAKGGSTLW